MAFCNLISSKMGGMTFVRFQSLECSALAWYDDSAKTREPCFCFPLTFSSHSFSFLRMHTRTHAFYLWFDNFWIPFRFERQFTTHSFSPHFTKRWNSFLCTLIFISRNIRHEKILIILSFNLNTKWQKIDGLSIQLLSNSNKQNCFDFRSRSFEWWIKVNAYRIWIA